jgi:predicted deacylase
MAHEVERIALKPASAGTERSLVVHRFGTRGARPKTYVQAGLHASEVPGMVVAHHLIAGLESAEIEGEIVVVAAANPIGLGDVVLGVHLGRYAASSGANFNRGFVDLAAAVAPRVEPLLTEAADENVGVIRRAMGEHLAARRPRNEIDDLRLTLLRLAADADHVFDLHAEEDAMFAAVLAPWTLPAAERLLADLGPQLVFYADYPQLFDTACSRPWADLAKRFPGRPIPQACLSVTLELRGSGHVDDAQAKRDAEGLLATLRRNGHGAESASEPPPLHTRPIRFEGVEFVRAAAPGIVVYKHDLGDAVEAGNTVAEIVQPHEPDPSRVRLPVLAGTSGVLFARRHAVVVQADDVVAKIAGERPLDDPKHY